MRELLSAPQALAVSLRAREVLKSAKQTDQEVQFVSTELACAEAVGGVPASIGVMENLGLITVGYVTEHDKPLCMLIIPPEAPARGYIAARIPPGMLGTLVLQDMEAFQAQAD